MTIGPGTQSLGLGLDHLSVSVVGCVYSERGEWHQVAQRVWSRLERCDCARGRYNASDSLLHSRLSASTSRLHVASVQLLPLCSVRTDTSASALHVVAEYSCNRYRYQ